MKKIIILLLTGLLSIVSSFAGERSKININPAWKFHLGDPGAAFESPSFNDSSWEDVALPHTLKEVSLDLDDCNDNNKQSTFHRYTGYYRKTLTLSNVRSDRNYFLEFQGAMQTTELWVNGKHVGKYERSGYDSFHFDITTALKSGENIIAIKVDNRVNELTPPDGKNMSKDFILFGGLYRDLFFVSTSKIYVNFPWEARNAGVKITFPKVSEDSSSVRIATTLKNDLKQAKTVSVRTRITNAQGGTVARIKDNLNIPAGDTATMVQNFEDLKKIELWSPDTPTLYTAESRIFADGRLVDTVRTRFGVRSIEFTTDKGFFLNGKHVKLQGANRHQSWPFIGNAVPNSLHRRDAELIKNCGMNWVRLSHYPHDPDFLDACDELGLMALEEGPTWMRDNGEEWLQNLYYSFRSMIRRDRNHPSIIVWNACINHSRYKKELGEICKEEDTRPIGALLPKTPMDFRHGTISGGGALSIEHTGHTYPRGRGLLMPDGIDGEWELAKRHWEHINASYLKEDNAGMAVWCMFDYNTFHNINERGMVWHGVCDLTRIPKYSYQWFQSELTKKPMTRVINYQKGKAGIFSNCEQIELFQNSGGGFKSLGRKNPIEGLALHHPPFEFDIAEDAVALKAVGFIAGKPVATNIWRRPGLPVAVKVEADSRKIIADGSDLTRIVATIVDKEGTPVAGLASEVYFEVKGNGRIVGDNPAIIRNGKAVVLLRSCYSTGELKVTAASPELKSGNVTVTCVKPAKNVLLPGNPPEFKADKPIDHKGFAWLTNLSWRFMQSKRSRWNYRSGPTYFREINVNGKNYTHAVSGEAPLQVVYSLGGLYKEFSVTLVAMNGQTSYSVFLDGVEFCKMENLEKDKALIIPLDGVQSMRLLATRKINTSPKVLWAEARLTYGRSAKADHVKIFDETVVADLKTIQEKDPAPKSVKFQRVKNAEKGAYVTSNVVMINGDAENYPITIKDGEYRIYSGPWTNKKGSVKPGDAVTLRIKANKKKTKAKLKIGGFETTFEVIRK